MNNNDHKLGQEGKGGRRGEERRGEERRGEEEKIARYTFTAS
jgi:hypothetical protein